MDAQNFRDARLNTQERKMNRVLYLALILAALVYTSAANEVDEPHSCNCTHAPHQHNAFKQALLSRRTRSFVFPNKAFLLLTPAITKAVLDGRPRGLMYSIEFDMYSPLPDTPEGWKPTILFNNIKMDQERERLRALKEAEKAQPTPPPAATAVNEGDAAAGIGEIVVGAADANGGAEDDASPAYSDSADFSPNDVDANPFGDPLSWSEVGIERYDYPLEREQDYINTVRRFDAPWQSRNYDNFQGPDSLRDYYARNFKRTHHNLSSNDQNNIYKQFHKIPSLKRTKSKYSKSAVHSNSYKSKLQDDYGFYDKWSSYGPTEEVYHTPESVPAWKYHQDYRERRELFDQLEAVGKIFNMNMKACIQRAMCEITQHLSPYGSSMMEDIVRIILTIPTDLNFDDDYSRISHKLRNVNCARHFAVTCPYPVLELLTKNMRNINLANNKDNL